MIFEDERMKGPLNGIWPARPQPRARRGTSKRLMTTGLVTVCAEQVRPPVGKGRPYHNESAFDAGCDLRKATATSAQNEERQPAHQQTQCHPAIANKGSSLLFGIQMSRFWNHDRPQG